ncbi:MAG: hypothetical protein ABFQ65_02015 [Nanoarchaeota archaeon]
MQDTSKIKEQILFFIKEKGPSLPVNVAKKINFSPLFASVFLSELFSEKKLKISHLRVGNSPLYFISGQESQLENFAEHIKSKEKEAFLLLKEKKFLEDIKQEPAIRVALRSIKDFAFPFEKNNKFFWRYFIIPESQFIQEVSLKKEAEISKEKIGLQKKQELSEEIKKEISQKKKSIKKKTSRKKDNKFFNKIKEFLAEESITIIDIEEVSQGDLMLKVNENENEKLIVAYNKKRITETEIIKANKKATEMGLNYTILSFGEPAKKLQKLIDAVKNLSKIKKLK